MGNTEYEKCLESMYGLKRFGIKLGLSTIRSILNGLNNPQNRFACIHIAGTNGKGSVASALSTILTKSGFKTGLYTSPHLVRFNERICIDHQPIKDDEVLHAYEMIRQVYSGDREPTFFEFATAMALYYFGKNHVDVAIIETGMGGRLDATNIINPVLSIITNISVEHKEYLGDTIYKVAQEKAGIIKKDTPVVTGVRQKDAVKAVQEASAKVTAPVFRQGDAFKVRRNSGSAFTYFGISNTWKKMQTILSGNYQVDNAALTLAACEVLIQKGYRLPLASIKKGLAENQWPGRLEVVSTDPYVLLDGAHNLMAARNLGGFLKQVAEKHAITMVVGILDDKPYRSMLKDLLAPCKRVIITRPKINRSLPVEVLHEAAAEFISDITMIEDVDKALLHAMNTAKQNDAICAAGSLYVVGEAKTALEKWKEKTGQ